MRMLRLSLVGTVIFGLLAALPAVVVAQSADEQEPPTATYATSVVVSEREDADYSGWEVDWSDPRLPSRAEYRFSAEAGRSIHPDGTVMAAQMVAAVRPGAS